MAKLTYKDAGVDVEAGRGVVSDIKRYVQRTFGPRVIGGLGGFAGLFSLDDGSKLFTKKYKHPVLVACTDGVGTKLKIAFMVGEHRTVGIDLVAMCVNDLIACGAEPLFFLDYLATGRLRGIKASDVIRGISDGCEQSGCALLGGETAEMPGFYGKNEYDIAGFAVGVVERDKILDGKRIEPGDKLIGILSSGLHSNGYSLVRKVLFDRAKMSTDQYVEDFRCTLGEELLRPTKIYAHALHGVLREYKVKAIVKGISHITGGGLPENVPRMLPSNCFARIRRKSWKVPPVFKMIQDLGGIDEEEMYNVFNMGIGMVLAVPPYYAEAVIKRLQRRGEGSVIIGEVRRGARKVELV